MKEKNFWWKIVGRTETTLKRQKERLLSESCRELFLPFISPLGYDLKDFRIENGYVQAVTFHKRNFRLMVSLPGPMPDACLSRSNGRDSLLVAREFVHKPEELRDWLHAAEASWSPLHKASWNGHVKNVSRLIADHDVDSTTPENLTPLMVATARRRAEVVRLLLEAGADTEKIYHGDRVTALDIAAGHQPWMCKLSNQPKLEIVRLLLEHGAVPNIEDGGWRLIPSLLPAIFHGHAEIVEAIISAGADVNWADSDDYSCLDEACMKDAPSLEIVKLLLEAGAKFSAISIECIDAAKNVELINLLIAYGANA